MAELPRASGLFVSRRLCQLVVMVPWAGDPFRRLLRTSSRSSAGVAPGRHSEVGAGSLINGVERCVVVEMGVPNFGGAYGPRKATLFVTLA